MRIVRKLVSVASVFLLHSVCFNTALAADFQVGLLLDKAGKDDASFNASAYRGLMKAEAELKVKTKTVEAKDTASAEALLRSLANKKYNLLIAIGFSQADAVKRVAMALPKVPLVIVDAEVSAPNVTSVMFAEHEGSLLMGAIAALKSKNKHVGFVGGMDVPLIRRFYMGYEAGAQYVGKGIKVSSGFIGVTGDAFNNPPKAKEMSLLQHSQGADVIFHAAGASGKGVFDAAEEKKFLAIGCDSNQNGVKPGVILTSMLKRVDVAVFDVIAKAKDSNLPGGKTVHHDVASGGIDWALDEHNKPLIAPDLMRRIDDIKSKIKSKAIQVPDYYVVKASGK